MPTEEHTPRVYIGGGAAWVRCNCGWQSQKCAGTQDASFEWSEHVAEMLRATADKDD